MIIFIGFAYGKLDGIVIDLYRMYKFLNIIDEVHLITDIECSKYGLTCSSLQSDIDENVHDFISACDTHLVNNPTDAIKSLEELLMKAKNKKDDKLFLYISGHGVPSGIVCADEEIFLYSTIYNFISNFNNIITILDCCHATSFNLPYRYEINRPRLKGDKFIDKQMIVLAASNEEEKAKMESHGSYFTKHVIDFFNDCRYNRKSAHIAKAIANMNVKNVGKGKERYTGYCSFPSCLYLPTWILGTSSSLQSKGGLYIYNKGTNIYEKEKVTEKKT